MTLTVAEYASAKHLPEDYLRAHGVRDDSWHGEPAVAIPYHDQDGHEIAVRYRVWLNGTVDKRFKWALGTKAKGQVLGLADWKVAAAKGHVLVVEGESDQQTARLHGLPCFGIPGAGMFDDELTTPALDGIGVIYVVQEPGEAGERFVDAFRNSRLATRAIAVRLPHHKDLSELHLDVDGDHDRFLAALAEAIAAGEKLAAPAAAQPTHTWTPINLATVGDGPTEKPTILDITYPDGRHSWHGDSETCKSLLAQIACAELAQHGKRSIYIETDGAGRYGTRRRFSALGLTDDQLALVDFLEPDEPLEDPSIQADIRALLETRRPELVVVDALDAFLELHGLNPNSNSEVQRGWRLLEVFRATGAPIVAIDHVVKAAEDRKQYAAGAGRKRYGVDVSIGFETIHPFGRGRTGRVRLTTHKDRPSYLPRPRLGELELRSDPDTGAIAWTLTLAEAGSNEATTFRPTTLMERVSLYVGAHGSDPPSRNKVETDVQGKRDYVRVAIDVLLAEGYLHEDEGPRNARLLQSVKPYREADDDAS